MYSYDSTRQVIGSEVVTQINDSLGRAVETKIIIRQVIEYRLAHFYKY